MPDALPSSDIATTATRERNRKVLLPPCLLPHLQAYAVASGDEEIYVVRDRSVGKSHDFDSEQFFILTMMSAFDSHARLQAMVQSRFGRRIDKKDVDEFFASLAERELLTDEAYALPLLRLWKPKPKEEKQVSFGAKGIQYDKPLPPPRPIVFGPDGKPVPDASQDATLPAGVQDAIGMDWRTTEKMLDLFNPGAALKVLTPILYPLRVIIYITPVLLLAALVLDFKYESILISDLNQLHANITLWGHLLFVFVTVHVVTTLAAGVVATAYGVKVEMVGLTFTLGFMPRWVLRMNGAENLNRKRTMWLHGATLIARVVMFSLGSFLWFNTRDSKADLAQTGLLFFFSCAIGLLVESGNPLIKANGYYLISAYINEPHLRARAYSAVLNKWKGIYKATDNAWLVAYGVISTLYIVFIILLVGFMLFKYVYNELNLGGSAILITIGFIIYLLWLNYDGLSKFAENFERQIQYDRWRNRTLINNVVSVVPAVQAPSAMAKPRYWPWAVAAAFVIVLFLPYPYQAGGPFTIYPVLKQVISTDTSGVIDKVYFDGGESVKAGTVLATLAHEDYQSEIAILKAQIVEQAAVVDNLKTLPKPEEVAEAAQDLEIARENERYSAEKAPRLERMYRAGAISFEEYDKARKDNLVDQQQTKAKEAKLALVKVPVTADEIAAAEGKLDSLHAQLASYESKVSRTTIRMPFDGNILTLHLQDRVNSFLKAGQPFAALEYTGTVTAQIAVPEPDIGYVKLGLPVKVRATSYADQREFEGRVTQINRGVTVQPGGNVIEVIASVDNPDGLLKTGMEGVAKVEGTTMPVWKAFTLSIERWVEINLWGLIP